MRAEWKGKITSLDLLAMLLLMQPRIRLAFWAANMLDVILLDHNKFFILAVLIFFLTFPRKINNYVHLSTKSFKVFMKILGVNIYIFFTFEL